MAPFFSWADGMLKWFSDWLRQRRARSIPVAASQWAAAESEVPALHGLPPSDRERLRRLVLQFLADKEWTGAAGLELTPHMQLVIALQACLPILNLGLDWYDDWRGIVVYPEEFAVNRRVTDDIGLVHNQRIVQSGQSWQQGPIVLNWLDIQDSFDASGFNLIIHEVAHKLDTRNGDRASGVPFIPLREVAGWEHDLHAAMNNIQEEIELVGENAASIDAYAASDPAECFAVLSEYFFSAPELFAPRFPSLWQRFCQFYQQDPLQRLHHANDTDSFSATNVH